MCEFVLCNSCYFLPFDLIRSPPRRRISVFYSAISPRFYCHCSYCMYIPAELIIWFSKCLARIINALAVHLLFTPFRFRHLPPLSSCPNPLIIIKIKHNRWDVLFPSNKIPLAIQQLLFISLGLRLRKSTCWEGFTVALPWISPPASDPSLRPLTNEVLVYMLLQQVHEGPKNTQVPLPPVFPFPHLFPGHYNRNPPPSSLVKIELFSTSSGIMRGTINWP